MRLVPFFYLSFAENGLQLSQVTDPNSAKTKILKVMRQRETNVYEFFEFQSLSAQPDSFDVLAIRDLDTELWNVPDFFRKHLRDLLLGQPVNELNPRLVVLRLGQTPQEVKFVISYSKKQHDSIDAARKASVLQATENVLEDIETLKALRKKSFDNKFEAVFGINQAKFEQDSVLRDFKDHGV